MFTRTIAVAAALMLFAAPANAFYCPKTGKAITHAVSNNWKAGGPRLSGGQIAEVKKLRDEVDNLREEQRELKDRLEKIEADGK